MNTKLIRDFIYVDKENLYSLYSQVFEGVAEQIVHSALDEVEEEQKSPKLNKLHQDSFDSRVVEASIQTESKILLDHIYNRLENKISNSIHEIRNISKENYKEETSGQFLIKVSGKAEIEDYERVKNFTERFNKITEAIAYASISQDEKLKIVSKKSDLIEELERNIKRTSNAEKAELQRQLSDIKKWIDPDVLLKLIHEQSGLALDQKFLEYFCEWFDFFYPNGFEITIVPACGNNEVVFRGVIDRRFLRLNPQYLRALFGNFVDADWVMVGQVTYFPGTKTPEVEEIEQAVTLTQQSDTESENSIVDDENIDPAVLLIEKIKGQATSDEPTSLRDPVRGLFKRAADFDKMFFESKTRIELLVRPLAIYREFALKLEEDSS